MEKDPLKKAADKAQNVPARDRDLLLALGRAAQTIQRARTAEDFYRAVGREIKSLGGDVTLLTINEDRRSLSIAYTSYAATLIRRAEKLVRLSARDYPIPLRNDGYYGRTLNEGRALFFDSTREIVAESLPRAIRSMAEPLTRLLKLHQGILAPLRLEDETLGFMTVSSTALTAEHLPGMESFAGQIAAGLSNVRLTQQLMEELTARRRVEESLQRNRGLLLALSRAAQDVQKMNDQEGIYRVVGEQIKALGFDATILMLDEEKKNLCLQYTTIARKVIRAAEKITGLKAEGYRWPIPSDNAYRRIIDLGRSEYIPDASLMVAESLPPATRPVARQLMGVLGAGQGIIVPLHVDEAAFGLLVVFGKRQFSVEDLPAMDSFAGQVAISLRNLRLSQQVAVELAERKQAEEILRESKDRYRVLYEDNPSMYFTADPQGVILSVNRFCMEKLGYAEAELVGRPIFDIFQPEDRDMAHHQFTACLQNPRQTVQIEAHEVRKNGELLWVRETASAVLDGRGKMVVLVNCIDITKRKNAEQALADSEAELRALFASMHDTVLVIDQNGFYRKFAPTYPGKLYNPPEEVIGKHLRDFFPAAQVERFMATIQQVMETGQTLQIDYEMEVSGWGHPWFEASISPVGTDCTLWVARDITDRKQAQAALTRSEQAYRSLFENMPIGLYRTSLDGRILDANPALVRMFGYPDRDALLAVKAVDLYMDPAYEERFKHAIQSQGTLAGFEAEFSRYGNSAFWAEDYVHIVRDEQGTPLYYEGSLIDVTERKRIERALKESEQKYRLLAEGMGDVVWVLDTTGTRFKYISPSTQKLLGYTPEEMMTLAMKDIIAPASLAEINASFPERAQRFLAGDPSTVTEITRVEQIRKDGSSVFTEVSTTLVRNEWGEIEAIGVSRDITERKRAEDESRRANIALETAHAELQEMFAHEQVLARTDGMTGLFNRRYFFELAMREFNASQRYQRPLTIILFDVDGFKQVNDTFGHAMGDAILIQIARVASQQIRNVDVLARYGGDEFVILLPETNAQQAFQIAERTRECVAVTAAGMENSPFSVTLSLGVAEVSHSPQDASVEDAIRRADQALYTAKARGNNCTVIFGGG